MRMPKGYSIEPVTTPTWQKMQTGIVVCFTVTGANEAGVDLVLIHPSPFVMLIHVILMLTCIF